MAARIVAIVSCLNLALVPARAEPIPYWQQPADYLLPTTLVPTPTPTPLPVPPSQPSPVPSTGYDYAVEDGGADQASVVRFQPDGSSPGFFCEYPSMPAWEACNGPDSRDCWLRKTAKKIKARCDCDDDTHDHGEEGDDGDDSKWGDLIDVHTDYENPDLVPRGIVREYWIEHDGDITLTADGFQKTTGKVFNKTFPAPIIEACWGDQVKIHVKNNYEKNGTTIHWHGIRQLGTNQADGANGVTQCPIAQGDTYTYEWTALQYGSTWYHSHYAIQYADGAVGPLVIYGPHSGNWDVNLGPVLVQDYVHQTAFNAFQAEKSQNNFARTDSIVVNGKGHDPATGTGSYSNIKLTPGKKHLIRLINSSVGTSFVVSIDGHTMKVVASDLVAIEPYETTSLHIGIGQRYTIIVEANQAPGNYWIRTHPATGCNGFAESLGVCPGTNGTAGTFTDDCVLFDVTTAIASYDDPAAVDPGALPTTTAFDYSRACVDEPYASLRPVVPWVIDDKPANNITRDRFSVARQRTGLAAEEYQPGGYQHWEFTPEFLWINFEEPTILNTTYEGEWDPHSHIIEEPYNSGFIFMIFEANTNSPTPDDVTVIALAHPIHWHGHDVVVLAQSQDQFDPDSSFDTFNFDNPPRRDVVILPANGFIAIAMRADNPGAWLIHCHIAWHSSAGLAMQNLESQSTIVDSLGGSSALDETRRVCDNWKKHNDQFPIMQDESGV